MPESDNYEDALRWLQEGHQRSQDFVADMGYDTPAKAPDKPRGKPWQVYLDEFWQDNPGYAAKSVSGMKTTFSYLERVWKRKPLGSLVKRDLVDVADFLRDFVSERHQRPLSYKTIQHQLGEVRSFLRWAIGKDYLKDDSFELVRPRKPTTEEKNAQGRRRSFTHAELKCFFQSDAFAATKQDDGWWLAVLCTMTGARGGELMKAPSELVIIGDTPCIDLREAGTKTKNAFAWSQ